MTDTTDIKALRTLSMQRVKEIANGDSMLMGERVDLANTAIRFHKELDVALDAFKNAATELFSAQEQLEAERQRADELQAEVDRVKQKSRNRLQGPCKAGDERDKAEAELAALKGDQVPVAIGDDIIRDANRYRFLRDEDAWGEDSDSWDCDTRTGLISSENLMGGLSPDHFDDAIDARMAASDIPFLNPATAPQKPVGLRQIGSIDHDGGEFAEYFVEFTDSAQVGQAVYVIDSAIEAAGGIVAGHNDKVDITCWSCRRFITFQQHAEADGFCPHCSVEIELDDKDGE